VVVLGLDILGRAGWLGGLNGYGCRRFGGGLGRLGRLFGRRLAGSQREGGSYG
jgi:hypothetical protein